MYRNTKILELVNTFIQFILNKVNIQKKFNYISVNQQQITENKYLRYHTQYLDKLEILKFNLIKDIQDYITKNDNVAKKNKKSRNRSINIENKLAIARGAERGGEMGRKRQNATESSLKRNK